MEKEFVSYEQAVALKELGIYISPPCYSVYRKYNNINAVLLVRAESMETIDLVAPLKQQVFRWLSLQLNDKDIMIPVDYEAQDKLIDVLIDKLKTKHLLL